MKTQAQGGTSTRSIVVVLLLVMGGFQLAALLAGWKYVHRADLPRPKISGMMTQEDMSPHLHDPAVGSASVVPPAAPCLPCVKEPCQKQQQLQAANRSPPRRPPSVPSIAGNDLIRATERGGDNRMEYQYNSVGEYEGAWQPRDQGFLAPRFPPSELSSRPHVERAQGGYRAGLLAAGVVGGGSGGFKTPKSAVLAICHDEECLEQLRISAGDLTC